MGTEINLSLRTYRTEHTGDMYKGERQADEVRYLGRHEQT